MVLALAITFCPQTLLGYKLLAGEANIKKKKNMA
jgi:hypothetical protein